MSRHRAVRNLDIDGKNQSVSCLYSIGLICLPVEILEEDEYDSEYEDENECKDKFEKGYGKTTNFLLHSGRNRNVK